MRDPSLDQVKCYYETLELTPGAGLEEITRAYRTLVRVWHPDRFASDSELKARATERMVAINAAHHFLAENWAQYPAYVFAQRMDTPVFEGQQDSVRKPKARVAPAHRWVIAMAPPSALAIGLGIWFWLWEPPMLLLPPGQPVAARMNLLNSARGPVSMAGRVDGSGGMWILARTPDGDTVLCGQRAPAQSAFTWGSPVQLSGKVKTIRSLGSELRVELTACAATRTAESPALAAPPPARPYRLPNGAEMIPVRQVSTGRCRLTVENGTGRDAVVRLRDAGSGELLREFYVLPGQAVSKEGVAPGAYRLQYATGLDWSPHQERFLYQPRYVELAQRFEFHQKTFEDRVEYTQVELTLQGTPDGNIKAEKIEASQFLAAPAAK